MTDPAGGFYSAQDADSEGEEGKFFVWTADEIRAVLGADAEAALAYWGVDRGPNFEGKSILWVPGEPDPERVAPLRRGRRPVNKSALETASSEAVPMSHSSGRKAAIPGHSARPRACNERAATSDRDQR